MKWKNLHPLAAPLVLVLLALACEIPYAPTPSIANSPPPGSIKTLIVETAAVAQTQTIAALPLTATVSVTPSPTRTPTDTPTPTETIIIKIPTGTDTPTPTPGPISVGAGCELIAQTPANNEIIAPKTKFNPEWTFRNTGSDTWYHGDYDFEFISGDKFYKAKRYDLPSDVEPGNEVTITGIMKAPEKADTYTSTWGLISGGSTICEVTFTIVVK
jgi:hypothetical protein